MLLYPTPHTLVLESAQGPQFQDLSLVLEFSPSPRFQQALHCAGVSELKGSVPLELRLEPPSPTQSPESYGLNIEPRRVALESPSEEGLFRGLTTLRQIAREATDALPCLRIEDGPDLPVRGYMLDISRCKVPRLETLLTLIDRLADLKFNQLQLYTEHVFAYPGHEEVWKDASPCTAEEIRTIDAYCYDRYIELVPNQNSFGHMERWLRHEPYRSLAECPDGYIHPILGRRKYGGTLKPNQASLDFVASLYDALLPHFRSAQFNIGGDEPWELGQGWSAARVEKKGKRRVYLDHLLGLHQLVAQRGKTMQFWGDIILEAPELIPELPGDVVGLIWGYEADHPFASQCAAFRDSGIPFLVAPGTSTWNTLGGRTRNAAANIEAAIRQALRFGAQGMLLTDWGDFGHHHPLPISYPAIARAGSLSWNLASADNFDPVQAVNAIFFEGDARELSAAILALGEVHEPLSHRPPNRTLLNDLLFATPEKLPSLLEKTSRSELDQCRSNLIDAKQRIELAATPSPETERCQQELTLAADLLLFGIQRGLDGLMQTGPAPLSPDRVAELDALSARYQVLWRQRNRPGGLAESAGYLRNPLGDRL